MPRSNDTLHILMLWQDCAHAHTCVLRFWGAKPSGLSQNNNNFTTSRKRIKDCLMNNSSLRISWLGAGACFSRITHRDTIW